MSRDHERHVESVGAYVLGALPELEAQAFERHVMGCAQCREEIERLKVAAEALPRSVPPLAAPPTLRRSLRRIVEGEASRPREGRLLRVRRRLRPTIVRIRPSLAWTSAAFLLAVGIAGGFGAASLLQGEDGVRSIAARVDESRLAEGSGRLLVPDDRGERAVLSVHGLPPLPGAGTTDEVYQLWLVRHGEVVPSSLFSVNANGSGGAAIIDDLEGVDAVWVTRERAGGARAPSEVPVMRIDLS